MVAGACPDAAASIHAAPGLTRCSASLDKDYVAVMAQMSRVIGFLLVLAASVSAGSAGAVEKVLGRSVDKQLGFNISATPVMDDVWTFHTLLLYIIIAITLFVFALLIWCMVRYNRRANPEPRRFSHNTLVEIVWTVVPILILVVIGFPSFRLLYKQDRTPTADMVIKATGHQWYWSYEYPDHGGISFDAIMLSAAYWDDPSDASRAGRAKAVAELQEFLGRSEAPDIHRLLDTDTRIVVPVDTTVKMFITASDVLHAWTIPSFGVKQDAVPGRLNETWFRADTVGTYYGQCSELCGVQHAFMPIVVEVVSQADFDRWVARAQETYALNPLPVSDDGTRLATIDNGTTGQ